MKLVVIGGSDAGLMASLRAKELSPETQVIMMLRDKYPNWSICGEPFYISGETKDAADLRHRTPEEIEALGIEMMMNTNAKSIDKARKIVLVERSDGNEEEVSYDKLIVATGANTRLPSFPGLNLEGVFALRWIGEMFAIKEFMTNQKPKSAAIIGAGYVGCEMADAFVVQGMQVHVVEHAPHVLRRTIGPEFSKLVHENLESKGIKLKCSTEVESIEQTREKLRLKGTGGLDLTVDMVIVATGATPNPELPQTCGLKLQNGAVVVNERMETNVADIYSAGDGVMTFNRQLKRYTYQPLGTTSHKQGRVAGANAVGIPSIFKGCVGTQVIKLFDQVIARSGLKEEEAKQEGINTLTVSFTTYHNKKYYPGAEPIHIRLTGDRDTQKIVGAEIVGHINGQIAKRCDLFAGAIHHGMTMEEFNDYDFAYTPSLSSPYDPTQMAAQAWLREDLRLRREEGQKDAALQQAKITAKANKTKRSTMSWMFS